MLVENKKVFNLLLIVHKGVYKTKMVFFPRGSDTPKAVKLLREIY